MRNLCEELIVFYENHPKDFADDIERLDDLNGCLKGYRRYPMDMLEDLIRGKSPSYVVDARFYGGDLDEVGCFNSNRHYFYVSVGGAIRSTDNRDYRDKFLCDFIIEDIIDHATVADLCLSRGAQEIIDGHTPKESLR